MTETPLVLDEAAVLALLPKADILDAMRRMFAELGRAQAVQPPQTLALFPEGRGDFITYLGASTGAQLFGAKLSPYLVRQGGPVITAWTLLMSMQTGAPVLLCDSARLTTERTAATTALAVDHLAGRGAARLAIVGTGKVAEAHLRHVLPLRDWTGISVFSPGLGGDRAAYWRGLDPRVSLAASAEDAAQGADVVMLCTSSGVPVLDTGALRPGVLVTSISTNVAKAHEVAPGFLAGADVYCDYRRTTPGVAGEMRLAQEQGWTPEAIRGDLAELATGACPAPSGTRPVFFRSVGLGLEDIFVAQAILAAARA
ncbi:MAG: ornithine cyclodeaminase family protein [Paracoccus sp. (in: a-proteobacteria)]|uniref:ornithine cyclodeaminase family protein n=1 Tax=Paracoccus sp. TaxID=267 RepID=UPI0039E6F3A1